MKRAFAVLGGSFLLTLTTIVAVSADGQSPAAGATPPTFARDVAPILFKHCASCHRPGEIGPMSFLSYEATRPWARAIQRKVVSREMPPWGADPAHTMKMRNDRSLSQKEIDTIVAWVGSGAPRGDAADLPPVPTFATGWQLGEPDYVFEMPLEWTIKAEGAEAYLYFYQPIPFTEDKFARAIEIRPSNFAVVHHSGAYVVDIPEGYTAKDGYLYDKDGTQVPATEPMGASASSGDDAPLAGASKLISYVPGRGIEEHPEGFAKRIPAGKYIRWVMHYNPTGEAQTDRSRLGIWFAKGPVTHEVL
ncbi:MAG: cytochrome c, partial [Acidobacteriota bacterium]|nr:cytochrome c [Acidobacteriota bacterium]